MTFFAGLSGAAISVFTRAMAFLAGIDPARVVTHGDKSMVVKVGLAMLIIGAWQAFVFSYIVMLATGAPDTINPLIVGVAIIAAIFIILLDIAMFMAPSWSDQGRAELKRAGLHIPKGLGEYAEDGIFLGLRAAFAVALVQLSAFVVCCLIYAPAMSGILNAEWRAANTVLMHAAESAYQRREQESEDTQASAKNALSNLRTQETAFRQTAVDPSAGDADLARLREGLTALEQRRQEADRELADAEMFAADELAGIRRQPGNSGVVGAGPVRRAAEERVAAAQRRVNVATQAIIAAKAELETARGAAAETASRKAAAAATALEKIAVQRDALEAEITRRESEHQALRAGREAFLHSFVEGDPTHVPLETGLLAKIGTLPKLAADPAKLALMMVVEVLFFVAELGAIFIKARSKPPSACARRLAFDDILDATMTANELADRLDQLAPRGAAVPAGGPRDAHPDNLAFGDILEPSGLDDEEVETEERMTHAVRRTGTQDGPDTGVGMGDGRVEDMVFGEKTTIKRKRGRPKGSKSRPRLPFDSTPGFFRPGDS
jgi:hypothetical protein